MKIKDIGTELMNNHNALFDTCYQYDCNVQIYADKHYYFNRNSINKDECFCSEYCLKKFEKEKGEMK